MAGRFRFPSRSAHTIREDVDAELRFHLEARADELVARGLSPDAARAQALQEFGDVDDARTYMRTIDRQTEDTRRRRGSLEDLGQDVRYALRALRAAPLFTLTAIVTLALGIGANVAIFSLVHGVLLRPLPYTHPEQLYRVWAANRSDDVTDSPVSAVDIDDWRAQRHAIADLGGWWYQENGSGVDYRGRGEPQRLSAVYFSPGFFSTLVVPPFAGRLPREEEMVRGGPDKVVLLTYGFWQRQFGGARSVIGTALTLGGEPYQVLGVLPASFALPTDRADVFIPYSTIPDEGIPRIRPNRLLGVVARARPGVSEGAVEAELAAIARRLAQQYPENAQWDGVTVKTLHESISGPMRTPLLVLLGAVGFVLLIACVNVASLLLARAVGRSREMALRSALGAARGRIVRQLLTESVVLSVVGGLAGLLVARAALAVVRMQAAEQLPRGAEIGLHPPVLAFALGLSLLTGIVFGLVPALRLSSTRLQSTLRSGGRGLAGSGDGQRLRDGLVIAEVALAVVLAVGAGLMTRSFVTLLRVDPGFRPEHLVGVTFSIDSDRHQPRPAEYGQQVIEAVRALPGVVSAAAVKDAPLRGTGENAKLPLPGGRSDSAAVAIVHVSDGYFKTLGTPIVDGREYTPQDDSASTFGLVVNQAFARKYFPGERLAGRSIQFGKGPAVPIFGVVGDVRQQAMDKPAEPTVYMNYRKNNRSRHTLVVRTQGEPLAMVRRIEETIWALDKDQTIGAVFTFDDAMRDSVARPRLLLVLLGAFGALGLGLGALGIYGVLAYLVSQRPREIGVRLALGAKPSDVSSMIVRRGLALTGAGLAIGVVGALALGRVIAGVLYGIAPTDPMTYVVAVATLLGVAALGSWLPARRAAGVDPAVTLRSD
jgi:predicted permease